MNIKDIFLFLIILLSSCSRSDDDFYLKLEKYNLQTRHNLIKKTYLNVEDGKFITTKSIEEFSAVFDRNYTYAKENGVEALLEKNGINSNIIYLSNYYFEIQNKDNVYDLLYSKSLEMGIYNEKDFNILLDYIELKRNFKNKLLEHNSFMNPNQLKVFADGISRDCGEAIIGSLITTIGAIGVGGPVGLGIWLVGKGFSTYQLIRACA
ncbi:hypothetical protein [Riemerella anatipestifer]|nr:hypothetical protein [Riemerella anatipestifer]MCU7543493.1 hypothetical protein [Riemerella anatipestifer]QYR03950.1 hypothetical protein J6M00_05980 [Riemerella anatipestifer]